MVAADKAFKSPETVGPECQEALKSFSLDPTRGCVHPAPRAPHMPLGLRIQQDSHDGASDIVIIHGLLLTRISTDRPAVLSSLSLIHAEAAFTG